MSSLGINRISDNFQIDKVWIRSIRKQTRLLKVMLRLLRMRKYLKKMKDKAPFLEEEKIELNKGIFYIEGGKRGIYYIDMNDCIRYLKNTNRLQLFILHVLRSLRYI